MTGEERHKMVEAIPDVLAAIEDKMESGLIFMAADWQHTSAAMIWLVGGCKYGTPRHANNKVTIAELGVVHSALS